MAISLRQALRGAVRAWRGESVAAADGFDRLFTIWWKVLSVEQATAVVREFVRRIIEAEDGKMDARFSGENRVAHLSSTREARLFEIYGVVRQLDADLADSLCREHRQLAAAVAMFPRGYHEEMDAAARAEAPPKELSRQCTGPDLMTVEGRWRLLPMPEALKTEFREPFDSALRLYARDTDPANHNEAPRECWPSAMEFRNILYKADQHEGLACLSLAA